MSIERVCVIGLGYIGLPTAALLACKGYQVSGVDINSFVVDTINQGKIHIVEPELAGYVKRAVTSGRLSASLLPKVSDVYIICVPTPFKQGAINPEPDLEFVFAAVKGLSKILKAGDIVILESTSPVGTTEKVAEVLEGQGISCSSIHLAYCPERVLPGKIMSELTKNDRVVGGLTTASSRIVSEFYRTFVDGDVFETNARTAELCKLTENSFRDVNIAFANELSIICDSENIDVWELIKLSNRHPRVNILQPGPGVGGHCIAVDPWFIVAKNPEQSQVIKMARERNNYKTEWVLGKIDTAVNDFEKKYKRKPKVACLGLAFKPDIDDLRESPAEKIVCNLLDYGIDVIAVEPNISTHDRLVVVELEVALNQADVIVILVKHQEFLSIAVKNKFKEKIILDFCGAIHH